MSSEIMNECEKWKNKRIRQIVYEIVGLFVIIGLLVTGLIFNLKCPSMFDEIDIEDLSLTVLQIQASISGIAIALLALISGTISAEYYGVSVSRYYLNIKPLIFKQNRTILCLVGLIIASILDYLFKFYIVILASAFVSCILIIISANFIYSAFINGKYDTMSEIDSYVDYMLLSPTISFNKQAAIFSDYADFWPTQSQNAIDYKKDKLRYAKAIRVLVEKNPEKGVELLQRLSGKLVKELSTVSEDNDKYRGLDILYETYHQILQYIINKELKHINARFDLLNECEDELLNSLYDLPLNDLETLAYWKSLTDIIAKVNIYCHTDEETDIESLNKCTSQLLRIPFTIGYVLGENKKTGGNIDTKDWDLSNIDYYFYSYDIPDDAKHAYNKLKRHLLFEFYYSLLKHGLKDIAINILEKKFPFSEEIKADIITFYLIIICYTYYLAERENLNCITQEEKTVAKDILESFKKDDIFASTIVEMCWKTGSIDFSVIQNELMYIIDKYERMPFDCSAKWCVANRVVSDFILLIFVMSSAYNAKPELLESIIQSESVSNWKSNYLGNNYETTRSFVIDSIDKLSFNFKGNPVLLDRGLSKFSAIVLNNYKAESLALIRDYYDVFTSRNINDKFTQELENEIKCQFEKSCDGFTTEPGDCVKEEALLFRKRTIPIQVIDDSFVEQFCSWLVDTYINKLSNHYYELGMLKLFERDKQNEEVYFSLFTNKSYIMVGNDSVFCPYEYEKREDFEKLTEGCQRISNGNGGFGMLIEGKGIPTKISRVSVSIKHNTLEDNDYEVDAKTGLYKYYDGQTYILYTKEELEEYIYKKDVVISISVIINTGEDDSNYGYYVKRNY